MSSTTTPTNEPRETEMSEQTSNPTDTTAEPDDATAEPEEQPDDGGQPAGGRDGAADAARYRRRAQEAEQQRDALQVRMDRADVAEVSRLAADILVDPSDLLLMTDLASLRGENGEVDPSLVKAAAKTAIEQHPHWSRDEADERRMRRMLSGKAHPLGRVGTTPRNGASKFFSGPAT